MLLLTIVLVSTTSFFLWGVGFGSLPWIRSPCITAIDDEDRDVEVADFLVGCLVRIDERLHLLLLFICQTLVTS